MVNGCEQIYSLVSRKLVGILKLPGTVGIMFFKLPKLENLSGQNILFKTSLKSGSVGNR